MSRVREWWRCPFSGCHRELIRDVDAESMTCSGSALHRFAIIGGYPRFAPALEVGKYDADYAAKYAFLWSYGYEVLGTGLVESIYQTVALSAAALVNCEVAQIAVAGLGVFRRTLQGWLEQPRSSVWMRRRSNSTWQERSCSKPPQSNVPCHSSDFPRAFAYRAEPSVTSGWHKPTHFQCRLHHTVSTWLSA